MLAPRSRGDEEPPRLRQGRAGDLNADDLATAGRVLGIVLERANAELARI